jgi:hypothetical protein
MSSQDNDPPEFRKLNDKITIQMFPEHWIQLNREVRHHPDLGQILAVQEDRDPYVMLAEISAFIGVVLDDTYSKQDIKKLCELLTDKLRERRTGIIMPPLH